MSIARSGGSGRSGQSRRHDRRAQNRTNGQPDGLSPMRRTIGPFRGGIVGRCLGPHPADELSDRGQLAWGKTAREVLAEDACSARLRVPDQAMAAVASITSIASLDDGDIYFVCNQSDREVHADCLFRVTGERTATLESTNGGHARTPVQSFAKRANNHAHPFHSCRTAVGLSSFAMMAPRPTTVDDRTFVPLAATGGALERYIHLAVG